MLKCEFDNDSGEYALAKKQAEQYPTTELESKIKGNLAEIAFQSVCREIIPIEKWHWHNGEAIRRAKTEYNDHDFTIFGKTVDVKARSNINKIFNIRPSNVNSDIIVLAWVPPEITSAVIEAEGIISLSNLMPSEHNPVTIIGWVKSGDLSPPKTEIPNPARGSKIEMQHLNTNSIVESPLNTNMYNWISNESMSVIRASGITANHTGSDGRRLYPGGLVTYEHDDDNHSYGVIVECPFEPARCEFDEETGEYSGGHYDRSSPAVGIVDLEEMTEERLDDIHQLAWNNIYPVIGSKVPEESEVNEVPSNSVRFKKDIIRIGNRDTIPDLEEWMSRVIQHGF
jgi:hypothetical protein